MHTPLIGHIKTYIDIDDKTVDVIHKYFVPVFLNNKDFLLQTGQICKSLYFVSKGCLRMFIYNEKGIEQITQFALENWWIADYFSFIDQKKTDYNIQAIEKSEIFSISYSSYYKLLTEAPSLEKYFRIIAQRALAAAQVRLMLNLTLSKEEMYLHFSSSFPDFVQRIPQYMLASYLGITPEYLSEIRKKTCK